MRWCDEGSIITIPKDLVDLYEVEGGDDASSSPLGEQNFSH